MLKIMALQQGQDIVGTVDRLAGNARKVRAYLVVSIPEVEGPCGTSVFLPWKAVERFQDNPLAREYPPQAS